MRRLLRPLLAFLLLATVSTPLFAQNGADTTRAAAIEQLEAQLLDFQREVRRLEKKAEDIDRDDFARDLRDLRDDLRDVQRMVRDLAEEGVDDGELASVDGEIEATVDEMRATLREAQEDLHEAVDELSEEDEWDETWSEDAEKDVDDEKGGQDGRDWDWSWDDDDDWRRPFERHTDLSTFVGDFSYRWPFQHTVLYRDAPALRYNRVEGLVLGIGLRPLEWEEYRRVKLLGQIGYAFALDEWRYDVGAETRLHDGPYANKLGVIYRRNTVTDDVWKSNWTENSMAAFLFKNDFFDYFEVEGWTIYGVQRLTEYTQVSAGFRTETYNSLARHTNWALFGGDDFGFNPAVAPGRMQSVVLAVEGGEVASLRHRPDGYAYRLEAEIGEGLGGDFSFNRFLGDVRHYLPVTSESSLIMRLRGGLGTGDVPIQKSFTLGGLGSMRGYPQNVFYGTRMLLANVEYTVDGTDLLPHGFDDLLLFAFFDAGWTGYEDEAFDVDDVYPSAGLGIGLDDRALRLELAIPLRDSPFNDDRQPSLWLRLNPAF